MEEAPLKYAEKNSNGKLVIVSIVYLALTTDLQGLRD